MRIRFSEISPHGSRFEIHEIRDLAEQKDFTVTDFFQADCTLTRKGDDKVLAQGKVRTLVLLPCDRCLGSFPFEVNVGFQLLFTVEKEEAWGGEEIAASPDDMETEVLAEPIIDLDDVVRQQVYLALPFKKLCGEGCKGLCLQCGANLNEAACKCATGLKDSPFAALLQLKK
jgi:uncharacterized protein